MTSTISPSRAIEGIHHATVQLRGIAMAMDALGMARAKDMRDLLGRIDDLAQIAAEAISSEEPAPADRHLTVSMAYCMEPSAP